MAWLAAPAAFYLLRRRSCQEVDSSEHEAPEGDPALAARIERLTPADRRQLASAVEGRRHHARATPVVGSLATAHFSPPAPPAGPFPTPGRPPRHAVDAATRAAKERRREVVRRFLEAHGIE